MSEPGRMGGNQMRKKRKKRKNIIKDLLLMLSVAMAILGAIVTFASFCNIGEISGKQLAVNIVVNILSMEYLIVFMYANDSFIETSGLFNDL